MLHASCGSGHGTSESRYCVHWPPQSIKSVVLLPSNNDGGGPDGVLFVEEDDWVVTLLVPSLVLRYRCERNGLAGSDPAASCTIQTKGPRGQ